MGWRTCCRRGVLVLYCVEVVRVGDGFNAPYRSARTCTGWRACCRRGGAFIACMYWSSFVVDRQAVDVELPCIVCRPSVEVIQPAPDHWQVAQAPASCTPHMQALCIMEAGCTWAPAKPW